MIKWQRGKLIVSDIGLHYNEGGSFVFVFLKPFWFYVAFNLLGKWKRFDFGWLCKEAL